MRISAAAIVWLVTAASSLGTRPALAQESRFAVVDLSESPNELLVAEVERQFQRLRPGSKPIDDPAMRRLLATGEGPAAAATRLIKEAEALRAAGDCAAVAKKGHEAETLVLTSVPLDDERDMLKKLYVLLVVCEDQLGHEGERKAAASHLRALVSLAPEGMPAEVWDKHVAGATPGPATVELQVDSEPANAQVSIDFHGVGVTPGTLKIAPGQHYVEVQKDGYQKSFRQITVGQQPVRSAFRLVERTHDRMDQARAIVTMLRKSDTPPRSQTLAYLSQYARVETLVMLVSTDNRVKISFFDAERGATTRDAIVSTFDPATGRVAELADRSAGSVPARRAAPTTAEAKAPARDALPEASSTKTTVEYRRRPKSTGPWWSWVLAGVIGASLLLFVYADQPQRQDTLTVHARWNPP